MYLARYIGPTYIPTLHADTFYLESHGIVVILGTVFSNTYETDNF